MVRISPALLLALLPTEAAAQEPWTTERYFPLTGSPGFIGLTDELQRRVDESGSARINHFCVVAQELRSRGKTQPSLSAITYWQETGDIQGYGQGDPDETIGILNTLGALHVDLSTGVVPTPEDIDGSTYRVARAWVDRLLRKCWRHGRTVVLIRRGRAAMLRPGVTSSRKP